MCNPDVYRCIWRYILYSASSDAHVELSRRMSSKSVYECLWVSMSVYECLLHSSGSDAHVELSKWSASVSIWADNSTLIWSHDADACMELQTASAAQNAQYNIRCWCSIQQQHLTSKWWMHASNSTAASWWMQCIWNPMNKKRRRAFWAPLLSAFST